MKEIEFGVTEEELEIYDRVCEEVYNEKVKK